MKSNTTAMIGLFIALSSFFLSCSDRRSNTSNSPSSSHLSKEWGVAELIETDDTGRAESPQIAMNSDGKAIAVWRQYDGSRFNIWASYFDGKAWGTAEMIETEDSTENSDSPQIAMNDDGNAIAVWSQYDGFRFNIWANYFDGKTWETAEMIQTGNAELPQIAMDNDGNAVAVWAQSDGIKSIRASYFNGTAWGTAVLIENDNTGNAYSPQVAMDGDGNAMAVWTQSDGFYYNIRANYFHGKTWGAAEIIDSNNLGSAYSPQIAMNSSGNAAVVWEQDDSFRYNIWANYFNLYINAKYVAEWDTGLAIETSNAGDAEYPQIAMDGNGNAIAVWMQHDGSRYNIWANYFDGTTWGIAELIETGDAGSARSPQVAMDDDGNAFAVWSQFEGVFYNIRANYFDGSIWGISELIETGDTGNAGSPQIAIDAYGNAIAVWTQFDGSQFSIYSNRFE